MKPFRYLGCFIALLLSAISLHAQTVPSGLVTVLNHTLDSMRSVTGAKSLSAAIQFSDDALWAHANGISSVAPDVPVTTNDAYLIGSVTKTITSACILQLADEGLLNVDDSIHDWLPPMPYINPDITIRQLLQHTSGLFDVLNHPDHSDSIMADITRVWTAEELIAYFMAPPIFQPGTSWSYCNTNYFLLGMIIKEATGNAFYTELRNRFFTPLGLNTFAIPSFETLNSPVAHLWLDINGDNVLDDANDFYMSFLSLNSSAGAAGGYFATPSDCTKWIRAYLGGDLITPAMMAEAKTTVNAPGSQGNLYGLGLMKNSFLGYEAWGHGGDLAYHASSWYFPELDASITVFTNDNNVTSWALLPVVQELLRAYNTYRATSIETNGQGSAGQNIKAYPNPFTDQLTVSLKVNSPQDKIDISLVNILGAKVATPSVTQCKGKECLVHFDKYGALPSAVYFVQAIVNGHRSTAIKVVKN